ncbi:MAG: hypothetical protein OXM61_21675 [Candidatus Poribacteria bacterium]|nr:hypothetical protein [Candidatus Poribacteria bacterium]
MGRFLNKNKITYILSQMFVYTVCFCLFVLFSPSGVNAKIVFVYNGSIYVMNDGGTGIRRLTDNQFWEDLPRWSPDGTQIAFERNLEKDIQKYQMFIMNADGTNQQQLTYNEQGNRNGDPTWSPDGRYLAFTSNRSGKTEIHVMDLMDHTVKQLTGREEPHRAGSPDWSPDGKEILYEKSILRGAGIANKNIWVMSADGTNQRPLLPDQDPGQQLSFRVYPKWSSDGQQILYLKSAGGLQGDFPIKRFVIMRPNGAKKEIDVNEKIGGEWVGSGLCSMDHGGAFLFSAGLLEVPREKRFHDIYRYEIATGKLRRLTRHRYDDIRPHWVEGALSVSPQEKLPTQWGEMKAVYGIETSMENEKYTSP